MDDLKPCSDEGSMMECYETCAQMPFLTFLDTIDEMTTPMDLSCAVPSPKTNQDTCRICYDMGDTDNPLIVPCDCKGSLGFVHRVCLHQWIRRSDKHKCELCKSKFVMRNELRPLHKWEGLPMTATKKWTIIWMIIVNVIAYAVTVWTLYIMLHSDVIGLSVGLQFLLTFAVSLGISAGLALSYLLCFTFARLWTKLKVFNREIYVLDRLDTAWSTRVEEEQIQGIGTTEV